MVHTVILCQLYYIHQRWLCPFCTSVCETDSNKQSSVLVNTFKQLVVHYVIHVQNLFPGAVHFKHPTFTKFCRRSRLFIVQMLVYYYCIRAVVEYSNTKAVFKSMLTLINHLEKYCPQWKISH